MKVRYIETWEDQPSAGDFESRKLNDIDEIFQYIDNRIGSTKSESLAKPNETPLAITILFIP